MVQMGWEIRGNRLHSCLEQHLLGAAELDPGDRSQNGGVRSNRVLAFRRLQSDGR